MLEAEGRLPDTLVACDRRRLQRHGAVPPLPRRSRRRRCIGVEAAGRRRRDRRATPPRSPAGAPGVLHGNRTYLLQDDDGQIIEAHSISAGLDYPGIGPEHAWLNDIGRVEVRLAPPTTRRWRPSSCCAGWRASSPRLSRAMRWPRWRRSRRSCRKDHLSSSISAAAATRTSSPSPSSWGTSCERRRRSIDHGLPSPTLRFAALKAAGRAGLVTFVTAGDPDPDDLARDPACGLPAAGADLIELGMPFTDPMADGPAIQASSLRALKAGADA